MADPTCSVRTNQKPIYSHVLREGVTRPTVLSTTVRRAAIRPQIGRSDDGRSRSVRSVRLARHSSSIPRYRAESDESAGQYRRQNKIARTGNRQPVVVDGGVPDTGITAEKRSGYFIPYCHAPVAPALKPVTAIFFLSTLYVFIVSSMSKSIARSFAALVHGPPLESGATITAPRS